MTAPTPKNRPNEDLNASVSDEIVEISFDDLDSELDTVEGKISEIAKEDASENQGDSSGARSNQNSSNTGSAQTQLDERTLLREKLLKTAPSAPQIRHELTQILLDKRTRLEGDIRTLSRKKEYDLLSQAVAQLRAVIRQIELVAQASLEILKEIWLKVVHKFA